MKADLTNIKNFIFDLGNVLLDLDFNASANAFRKLGLETGVIDYQLAYTDPVFYKLEVGKISPEDFRNKVRELLKNPAVSDKEIDDAWCAMLGDIPAHRIRLLQRLGENFSIFLFSNTNHIHTSRLHAWFREKNGIEFPSLFVKDFYSHQIHERKPDISSYKKVIELADVNPAETLFVDDLEKNIAGAKKTGLKTFWLKNGMEISEALSFL